MQQIPQWVEQVLETLEQRGKKAYLVGGCVRDMQMGRTPQDWDVTTDALPQEVMDAFPGKAIPTGLQHGTVTVRSQHRSVEVTTFRRDGAYLDGRHPVSVEFTPALEEDLSRRDFTVNAMAMDRQGRLYDPFGGQQDLQAGLLRCVGEPDRRFGEDALRLMRALRFAATLGFALEEETACSIHRNRALLQRIAAERILQELTKLVCGAYMLPVLLEYPDVLSVFWPEIAPAVGFDQKNRHHCYTVWEHSVRAMEQLPPQPVLRFAMLLHDLGKPGSFVTDAAGEGHFYGHAALGARLAEDMLQRLRFDKESQKRITLLVQWHDDRFPLQRRELLGLLQKLGPEAAQQLLAVKRADSLAKKPKPAHLDRLEQAQALLQQLLQEGACYHISHLALSGSDLQRLGYTGPAIARCLRRLLLQVMDGRLPNEKQALCAYAEKIRER